MKIEVACGDVPFFQTDSLASGLIFLHALENFIHGKELELFINGLPFNLNLIERIVNDECCRNEKI